jgi:SAM-dependent methyltransferase
MSQNQIDLGQVDIEFLVGLRNTLRELPLDTLDEFQATLNRYIWSFLNLHEENLKLHTPWKNYFTQVPGLKNDILDLAQSARDARARITDTIKKIEADIDQQSQILGRVDMPSTFQEYSKIVWTVDARAHEYALARIRSLTSWQHPSLELCAGDSVYTRELIAGDPLYIACMYPETQTVTQNKFNEVYQRRLRTYHCRFDRQSLVNKPFSVLPGTQFGFIFFWNIAQFCAWDHITSLLASLHSLLKPGGVLVFNFNDCDTPLGVEMAKRNFHSWLTPRTLEKICQDLGFQFQEIRTFDSTSVITVARPGVLTTTRAHQVLGEIINT